MGLNPPPSHGNERKNRKCIFPKLDGGATSEKIARQKSFRTGEYQLSSGAPTSGGGRKIKWTYLDRIYSLSEADSLVQTARLRWVSLGNKVETGEDDFTLGWTRRRHQRKRKV